MRHIRLFTLTLFAVALASACGGRDMPPGGGGGGTSAGTGGGSGSTGGGSGSLGGGAGNTGGGSGSTGGGTGSLGGGSGACTPTSVTNALANLTTISGGCVSIDNAVVVGASTPFMSSSSGCVGTAMTETFYIQDSSGGPGFAVYKSCKDNTNATPSVGDVVSVSGALRTFDSSLQISSCNSTSCMIPEQLSITMTGGGTVSAPGAYAPAGMPIEIAGTDMTYAHDAASGNAHPEHVGLALHFSNVTVTDRYPAGFTSTNKDGGSTTNGFQLSNGVWVDDSIIYHDCIKPLGSDAGIPLPNGIKGFWDRYNDFYGKVYYDDGGFKGYSPPVAVLIPMTCADLQ